MIAAIYPGTFDPLTFGHLNIIARASLICNRLIVGVAENSGKKPLFSLEERLEMAQEQISKPYYKIRIERLKNKTQSPLVLLQVPSRRHGTPKEKQAIPVG